MRRVWITAIMIFSVMVLSACGSAFEPGVPADIVGQWDCDDTASDGVTDTGFYDLTVNEDGSFSLYDADAGNPGISGQMGNATDSTIECRFNKDDFDPPFCWDLDPDEAVLDFQMENGNLRLGYDGVFLTFRRVEAEAADPGAEEEGEPAAPTLLYMGHASLRIVTAEGKVIYIDPYAGDDYDLTADLILVTHDHYDHNALDLIQSRSDDCRVITWKEALEEGSFDIDDVKIAAVEAGNNQYHDISECVGYVLTFSNGKKVYVSGDTSETEQMADLAGENIDYAFFCCDGVYNMDPEEATRCAGLVKAKHNIPYHITDAEDEDHFDMERAERFDAPDRLILQPGQEIEVR